MPTKSCAKIKSYFFILISILGFALGDAGSFRKPSTSTNSDGRISEIQNELLKVQSEILFLNLAVSSGNSSQDLKQRLSTIENEFQGLKEQLADERRESTAANGRYNSSIVTLTNFYNMLDVQLKAVQVEIKTTMEEDSARRLPTEIAENIRSHRFAAAEGLLLKMADNERIHMIVHDVYANSQGNTDVLLDFAKALTKIDLSCYVLSALRYEMRSNGHRDPYKMVSLVRALEREVVNQKNAAVDVKGKAEEMINETVADITATATETLKAAMYSDTYQKNVQVETLANAIDDFRSEVSDEVMQKIVSETYPTVSADKIAENMYSNKYIPQKVVGLVALFQKLERSNDLNNNAVLSIGDYIKRISGMKDYHNISVDKKAAIKSVIEKMPKCAKSLFFASTVCLWNRGKSEYLYGGNSRFSWNRDRRKVFTWTSGEAVIPGAWYAEKSGNQFYFKNKAYINEYMYAADADVDPYDKKNRYVLTWVKGGKVGDKSAWNVELDGDYCYLKNENYGEYLYASDELFGEDRRYAFTWIPGTSIRQSNFQWQIRDCTDATLVPAAIQTVRFRGRTFHVI